MNIPNDITFRLLLSYGDWVVRSFYKFHMKNDEFYWWPSRTIQTNSLVSNIRWDKVSIEIPDNLPDLEKIDWKFSYHHSGEVHFKWRTKEGKEIYRKIWKWVKKSEILKPERFHVLISKTLINYLPYKKALNKWGAYSQVLRFEGNNINQHRIYIECFLSPIGTFTIPETLLKFSWEMHIITHSISPDLILVFRFWIMWGPINGFHPDLEICIEHQKLWS